MIRLLGHLSIMAVLFLLGCNKPPDSTKNNFAPVSKPVSVQEDFISSDTWRKNVRSRYGVTVSAVSSAVSPDIGEVTTIGGHPVGFGKTVRWNRKEKEAFLVAFLNARDDYGVCIMDLKKGDTIEITSATGIASFKSGDGKFISSLITLAASIGREIKPEAKGFIDAGEKFAKENFGQATKGMPRDPFGQDTEDGEWCKKEGGVLICLPEAGGIYTSGPDGLKDEGPRIDSRRPDHVKNGFFLVRDDRNHNKRTINLDGDVYIAPWDHDFEDNQGYYKVIIKVSRP